MPRGMHREDRYVASHKPFLILPSSFGVSNDRYSVLAIWFRKKRGFLHASFGELWDYHISEPNLETFLNEIGTSMYGGQSIAQWSSEEGVLWTPSPSSLPAQEDYRKLLEEAYQAFPDSFDAWEGWYVFN